MAIPAPKYIERAQELGGLVDTPNEFRVRQMIRDSERELKLNELPLEIRAGLYQFLAVAYPRIGRYDESLRYIQLLESMLPSDAGPTRLKFQIAVNHGVAHLGLGHIDEALRYLLRADELLPNTYLVYGNLAEAFMRSGDEESARQCLQEAIGFVQADGAAAEWFSSKADALFFLGHQAAECGFDLDAIELLRRSLIAARRPGVPESAMDLVRNHPELIPEAVQRLPQTRATWRAIQRVRSMSDEVASLQRRCERLPPVSAPNDKNEAAAADAYETMRALAQRVALGGES